MGVALPPEDLALFQERMHGWSCAEVPSGEVETYYLACAVLATVRIDRCARTEFTEIARKRKRAISAWERRQEKKVAAQVEKLDHDPSLARQVLETSTHGCRWLLDQWDQLGAALETQGGWTTAQAEQALRLRGHQPGDLDKPDDDDLAPPVATLRTHLAAVALADAGESAAELPPPEARDTHCQGVSDWILAEMKRLAGQHDALMREQDGPGLADLVNLACFDDSHQGALVRRYEAASKLEMHRMMNDLERHRKGERPHPASDSKAPRPRSASLLAESLVQPEP